MELDRDRSDRSALRGRIAALAATIVVVASPGAEGAAWLNVPLGTKLPEMTLTSVKGKKVKIGVGSSKALILLYVRPRHARSSSAAKVVDSLVRRYRSHRVKAIAVSVVRGDTAEIKQQTQWLRALQLCYPALLDPKEAFYGKYGIFVHPTAGVVDAKGILRYEYSSYRQGYDIDLERQLKAVLGLGPAPETIKDVDRNEVSPEELSKRRRAKMRRLEHRLRVKRVMTRLTAIRSLLEVTDLDGVAVAFRLWARKLPPPLDARLARLAGSVHTGKEPGKTIKELRQLARDKSVEGNVDLWLGRAQAKQGNTAEAKKHFDACAKLGVVLCRLEAALLVAKTDRKRATELFKEALDQALAGSRD